MYLFFVDVYVYVFVYVCTYVRTYVCMCVCRYVSRIKPPVQITEARCFDIPFHVTVCCCPKVSRLVSHMVILKSILFLLLSFSSFTHAIWQCLGASLRYDDFGL